VSKYYEVWRQHLLGRKPKSKSEGVSEGDPKQSTLEHVFFDHKVSDQ